MPDGILQRALPYATALESRPLGAIDLAVIHCTELPDLSLAREYGERVQHAASGTGNSGHFYIDRDGRTEQWVDLDRCAHHVRGHNSRSVGIELVNSGRYPEWLDSRRQDMREPYPQAQIDSLLGLLAWLQKKLPSLRWIAGHEELDKGAVPASDDPSILVRRKLDPGPMFPWREVLQATALQRLPDFTPTTLP